MTRTTVILPTLAKPTPSIGSPPEPPRVGDKVRIKVGASVGLRGVIAAIRKQRMSVDVSDGSRAMLTASEVTNYSAAARLAWRTMPKRAGRPANPERKIRVSLRVDEGTWH